MKNNKKPVEDFIFDLLAQFMSRELIIKRVKKEYGETTYSSNKIGRMITESIAKMDNKIEKNQLLYVWSSMMQKVDEMIEYSEQDQDIKLVKDLLNSKIRIVENIATAIPKEEEQTDQEPSTEDILIHIKRNS
jgi:hypothetical protein